MDEKDFELLQALADSRNITKAADKLHITQSALSKRIRSIERELGVELLLRSHQGIRFTPSGEAVLAHSRAAAREMEQMRRNLDALQGIICGTLNAGISINYALYRLPGAMADYHRPSPDAGGQSGCGGDSRRISLGWDAVPAESGEYLRHLRQRI